MKLTSAFIVMTIIVAGTNSSPALAQQQPSSNLESAKSRTQQLMGGVAPKLADLTDDVLYADIWERPELSKRDRSLVTVSALIALNRPDQLRSHLQRARDNGLTETELVETITHMAFYSGWPSAVSAVAIAREVFAEK
ncbi:MULTISPECIES: carboxymuconolactone decarboxylase family protein [unclassified Agrobacterium]|uniref:carboxymuconolactone decarboxylase family protein n=1 Tax=unclassified Agrobacterium TaxID=2632611 RepID=UPI002449385C|nr:MULTISPECIES: carboxymuconolactone decarboxylase family protein [unclassified Agrobacterium]MDH0612162.1 carboxymuconolactone decarboxylase family protein [Agrobacterium sp. GD03872]MDH0696059.1 carboxymuconolactone decarboxylase family protein [Agrobacterium sp. GD03871]MDH1058667.1 carboxymuconolactone decarboxylase family protein [Agrobacterium sp. GD03992]MDH2210758.1 carboxymuconolactone decarboxylase family protein [Agrobacterium sp. GD03643]MDH2217826.1 carboxymuconolactone decarboxy